MEKPTEEQIIHRAYELWEQNGKPEGRDDEIPDRAVLTTFRNKKGGQSDRLFSIEIDY